jgi:Uma2 family endonuclease
MSAILDRKRTATLEDLLVSLGGISPSRIRLKPAPGTAVEQDVIDIRNRERRLFELVEGVLVEKPMGYMESAIASLIIQVVGAFCEQHRLGVVTGEAGMMRLAAGLVRIPDVSVVLWDRFPGRRVPKEPIPSLAPDLAVEVLSESNTPAEIRKKLSEYFRAGTSCAWIIDPKKRTVRVYRSASEFAELTGDDLVTAETVLPGFRISVSEIFERSGIA